MDGALTDALVRSRRFFTKGPSPTTCGPCRKPGGREADDFYRDRWSHDKVVRSTHGVNCTGSCSWKVYVKDGIITWETQQTDYPSVGPDSPEYEPRGCPRGAAFSWYTYSPTRVRYPYVRGVLLQMFREAKSQHDGDPVKAWEHIVENPQRAKAYKSARGKGGLVRATWDEASEIVAAAHVHTIKKYGPDRVAGFSPIPAMSMVSHASGARFVNLIGGSMLSFYDWYADLPVASPQVFGDQTDVPESGDWWNAGYLIMWGSNLPVTRTPDAHWMTEARYRGQKVIAVAPDYADNVKFADEWLPARPGTDAALAMAMGHVVLKEFFVDRHDAVLHRVREDLHRPALPGEARGGGRRRSYTAGKFLTAADLARPTRRGERRLQDRPHRRAHRRAGRPERLPGSPLRRGRRRAVEPRARRRRPAALPARRPPSETGRRADAALRHPRRRGRRPARAVSRSAASTVTWSPRCSTCCSRSTASAATGLPGEWADGLRRRGVAVHARLAGGDHRCPGRDRGPDRARVRRERRGVTRPLDDRDGGRHQPLVPLRHDLPRVPHADQPDRLPGRQRRRLGALRRAGEGPPDHGLHPDRQRARLEPAAAQHDPDRVLVPPHRPVPLRPVRRRHPVRDHRHGPARRASPPPTSSPRAPGWAGCRRTPPSTATRSTSATTRPPPASRWASTSSSSSSPASSTSPARTRTRRSNYPRILSIWRANLLGSSGKGNEYFLKHLLGTDSSVRATETPEDQRPVDVTWRDEAPEGKLDLLMTIDFRQTSTTIFSDVVLPAATWYEKHDLNTTDMHPFVHSFNPAIAPPWQTRTDWDAWQTIAEKFSELAATHLGVRKDVVAVPLTHDTPDAMANPHGVVRDWKKGECEPIPGVTMPKLVEVERDYGAVAEKMNALGPLVDTLGATTKGVTFELGKQVDYLRAKNGAVRGGVADGRPSLKKDVNVCEAILALSGTTNGHLATQGFKTLEKRTGVRLADLAEEHEGKQITFADTQGPPVPVITSPEWSGSETGGRRYSPFTINVERKKPWHTLTGRMHFYLDHDWMTELGEGLPVYRPPLNMAALFAEPALGNVSDGVGRTGRGTDRALPDAAQQVVDPLGVPGQPVHALAVAWRPEHLDERPGRREGRDQGQRLDRGGQPQRRRGRPGDRVAPDARGNGVHVPRPGPADRRTDRGDVRQARRHPQLADPAAGEAVAPHRRLRPADLRVQLPRPHRQPARRGHHHPQARHRTWTY